MTAMDDAPAHRCAQGGTARKPRVARPTKAKTKTAVKSKPFACQESFVVSGGKLRQPMAVEFYRHDGVAYIKVSKKEAWLCFAAAGKARCTDPLARTTLIEDVAAAVSKATLDDEEMRVAPADAMAGLGLDEEVSPPVRGERGTSRKQPIAPVVAQLGGAAAGGVPHQVQCLNRNPNGGKVGKAAYIHCDHLPWVVKTLTEQVERGGVSYEPPDTTLRQPWWDLRERAWKCRAKGLDGKMIRKSVHIPNFVLTDRGCKRPMNDAEFKEHKRAKYEELIAWRDEIQSGFS